MVRVVRRASVETEERRTEAAVVQALAGHVKTRHCRSQCDCRSAVHA
jgi:hypothetical protein